MFARVTRIGLLVVGLLVCPWMTAILFSAVAEAFHGSEEPIFQALWGLMVGLVADVCVLALVVKLNRRQRHAAATLVLAALLLFDLAAIPVARWLIRTAYASPTNVIEWW